MYILSLKGLNGIASKMNQDRDVRPYLFYNNKEKCGFLCLLTRIYLEAIITGSVLPKTNFRVFEAIIIPENWSSAIYMLDKFMRV